MVATAEGLPWQCRVCDALLVEREVVVSKSFFPLMTRFDDDDKRSRIWRLLVSRSAETQGCQG